MAARRRGSGIAPGCRFSAHPVKTVKQNGAVQSEPMLLLAQQTASAAACSDATGQSQMQPPSCMTAKGNAQAWPPLASPEFLSRLGAQLSAQKVDYAANSSAKARRLLLHRGNEVGELLSTGSCPPQPYLFVDADRLVGCEHTKESAAATDLARRSSTPTSPSGTWPRGRASISWCAAPGPAAPPLPLPVATAHTDSPRRFRS